MSKIEQEKKYIGFGGWAGHSLGWVTGLEGVIWCLFKICRQW